jgi:hypothetical protein
LSSRVFEQPNEVFLHIYHFNSITSSLGLDIFHVGVEVCGCEVWYGASGVKKCRPSSLDPQAFMQTVPVGLTTLNVEQVKSLVEALEEEWPGEDYRLLDFNCQTFAIEFCRRLGLEDAVPEEYVRHGDVTEWAKRSLMSAVGPLQQYHRQDGRKDEVPAFKTSGKFHLPLAAALLSCSGESRSKLPDDDTIEDHGFTMGC